MINKKQKSELTCRLIFITKWLFITIIFFSFQLSGTLRDKKSSSILFDFRNPDQGEKWKIVTDSIIGGTSTADIISTPGEAIVFSGILTPFRYQNFCLTYCPPTTLQLRSYGGLLLRLKGDGKHYKVRIYNHTDLDGVHYQAGFNSRRNRLMTVFLPFSSFIPYLRRQVVRDWPVLDQSRIKRIGILISDQAAGPFRLEIYWIKAKEH